MTKNGDRGARLPYRHLVYPTLEELQVETWRLHDEIVARIHANRTKNTPLTSTRRRPMARGKTT